MVLNIIPKPNKIELLPGEVWLEGLEREYEQNDFYPDEYYRIEIKDGIALIHQNKCVGCGECARACPRKAITVKNRVARIDKKNCIKCYCCQELCPFAAIQIKKNLIIKLVSRL